jgi:predicted nucleic acid-binding protein
MNKGVVCIDASFTVRYLGSLNSDSIYQKQWHHWKTEGYNIVAPTLFMYEVCNAMHRANVAGQITEDEAKNFLEIALNLGIKFQGDIELHKRALNLAQIYNLPATYDAHYLALAERLDCELWTADRRLFNTVKSSLSWVKLVN